MRTRCECCNIGECGLHERGIVVIGEQERESFCTQATVQSALSFSVKCCRFAQSPLQRHLPQNDITHLRRVEEDEIKRFGIARQRFKHVTTVGIAACGTYVASLRVSPRDLHCSRAQVKPSPYSLTSAFCLPHSPDGACTSVNVNQQSFSTMCAASRPQSPVPQPRSKILSPRLTGKRRNDS